VRLGEGIVRRAATPTVLALLLLTVVPIGAGSANAASGTYVASCALNVRAKPTTLSTLRVRIPEKTLVTATGTVGGGAYGTTCGKAIWGTSWLAITAIGGRSVKSTYGVATVYAAAELFHAISAATAGVATGTTLSGPTVLGVDISQWNGKVDFKRLAASNRRFVIARATAGRLITDPAYARNRAGATGAGLAFAAYHYAMPDLTRNDALREADHFLAVAQLQHGMLLPVLDLEQGGWIGKARLTAWVKAWVERVASKSGAKPMIYVTFSFWRSYLADTTWFADHGYRLWIARWGSRAPSVPARGWGGQSWTVWQYSDCGRVAGIRGCLDLDRLQGGLAAIRW
jgi:GH25 family lysozyme M1 (1,4-beta-N-acetylmuramidase)